MKQLVETYHNLIFKVGTVVVLLSTLFLFSNLTTEFYDTPKFIILLVFTGLLLVLLALKFTLNNKVVFIRTPLDLPLLLLLVVAIISTVLSPAPYVSLLGHQLKISTSLVALATYVLFYFTLTNTLRSQKDIKMIVFVILGAGAALSVVSLLAYMGVKLLPQPWTHGPNFTPGGSTFSTTAVLAMLIPFLVMQVLNTSKIPYKLVSSLLLTLYGVTIALTGTWASWVAGLLGALLALLLSDLGKELVKGQISLRSANLLGLIGLATPLVAVVLITALSFIPPIGGAKNILYEAAKNFPREIQLPFVTSWKISVSAFRDSPFYGSGPSTYLFNFTNYKPIEFNSTKVWNLRFDSAFNEYLQVLGTLGGIGLLALVSLTALFISSAWKNLTNPPRGPEGEHYLLPTALAISGLVFFVILALHASSLVVWVIGLLILAAFSQVSLDGTAGRPTFPVSGIKQVLLKLADFGSPKTSTETLSIEALPSVLLSVALAVTLAVFFFGGKFVLADYHHRLALNAVAANNGVLAYNELVVAEKLNPTSDLYRTDLAQVNFALANAIAQAKAPTEASPGGSLTDQDKQNIQVLLQQSINEGRTAVQLSPRSAINWEILASLYRQISGVAQNALLFALDSYGRAIFQDPLNPLLRLNVGGTYYAIKNYDLAIRFFTDTINLKPDFANGYYNLSVALRDKGDLNGAIAAAQKVVELVEPKQESNPDFKVATDYLNDLMSKVSPPTPAEPPAAQTSGALQQKQLPKVIDLPKPEKIATPEAIKKPSPTPTPKP